MNQTTQDFVRPGYETRPAPDFPLVPIDWSRADAEAQARKEGLNLTEEHWQVVCVLQAFQAPAPG